jgi:type IV secretion system protein VirD4
MIARRYSYNPLAMLDPGLPSFNVQASLLADAMVTSTGKDPHWDESARAMVAAFIMYTVLEAREAGQVPTVARLRALLCEASEEPNKENDHTGRGIPKRALEMMDSGIAGLRNKASQFIDWNREIQSIASTAKRHTEPFDDPEISSDLAKGGFDFRDIKREPTTVYLILPPEMMGRHSKWLRLVLTAAIQGVLRMREYNEPKTLFMLDEFYALGHLEIISTVWALVRGYGVQIMPILQDLNQLKKLYPDMWETFIGMAGAVASFEPNDLTTAEWMSRRAGDTTRFAINYNSNSGTSSGTTNDNVTTNKSEGLSYSPVKAPLIDPHRLFGLGAGYLQISLSGLSNVIPAYAPGYYDIRQCLERARHNPYYLG